MNKSKVLKNKIAYNLMPKINYVKWLVGVGHMRAPQILAQDIVSKH